ncbi:DMT family transporter [Gorillibacterium timonense]|uniref:DMT family transporter n=1 Tax=Gorillibacterium timonense TaxID=1689269 RepID=UPI00071C72C8|nr:multidrug resistance efflux transporter family protein [Gorillibacterium timonense]
MRPIWFGIGASFLFASSFILNRSMELSGGSWLWSASLRYLFMLPLLLLLVAGRKNMLPLLQEMKRNPRAWLLWSTIGFGLFYAPLCFAAAYSPGWLTAATWQITIVSGTLLVPFFYETLATPEGPRKVRRKLPRMPLALSGLILIGIALMQAEHAGALTLRESLFGVIPVLVASVAYPLGNRKMMEHCGGRLDAFQRVLGMTVASLPVWLALAAYGWISAGPPSIGQVGGSLTVAVCSGVIATLLFFHATDLAQGSMQQLAGVEATQSMEVLFVVVVELLLGSPLPTAVSWIGMLLVMLGMVLQSYATSLSSGHLQASGQRTASRRAAGRERG